MTRDESYEWKATKEIFCKEVIKSTRTKIILISIVKWPGVPTEDLHGDPPHSFPHHLV